MRQLQKLQTEALYSAQTYYEASKRLDGLSRRLVFLPSCASAIAASAVALGAHRWLGAVSALANVMIATATYVGVERKANSYKRTAGQLTALRHRLSLEIDLASTAESIETLDERTREASRTYQEIVMSAEPTDNKDYDAAEKRIKAGTFATPDRPGEA